VRHFRLAMAHEPIPATVSHSYGFFCLLPLGRIREATEELKRALKQILSTCCAGRNSPYAIGPRGEMSAAREFRRALDLDDHFCRAMVERTAWRLGFQAGRVTLAGSGHRLSSVFGYRIIRSPEAGCG